RATAPPSAPPSTRWRACARRRAASSPSPTCSCNRARALTPIARLEERVQVAAGRFQARLGFGGAGVERVHGDGHLDAAAGALEERAGRALVDAAQFADDAARAIAQLFVRGHDVDHSPTVDLA